MKMRREFIVAVLGHADTVAAARVTIEQHTKGGSSMPEFAQKELRKLTSDLRDIEKALEVLATSDAPGS